MTTETVLSIRLKTEFAAAKADIEGLREKVRGMTEEARAGGAEAGRSAAGVAQLAESWLGVRAAVDPVAAATHRFEQAERVADAAVAAGIATKAEALQLLDAWAAKLDMVASKASAADALADFNSMKAGLDQAYAASLRLAEGQRIVAAAVQAGVVSEGEAARMLDLLATRLDMVGGKFGTLKAQADLDSLRAGLDPAYAASLQLAQGQEVLRAALAASAVEEAESARLLDLLAARLDMVGGKFGVARVTAEFEALRASIDPAYAATLRFAQAQEVANAAVSAGVTTQAQATQTLDVMAQKLGLAQGHVGKLGMSAQNSGYAAAGLAAQWNDVVMMVVAGQNPFMTAIQQGSQITQTFDYMRASGGAAGGMLGMLKSSVMSLVNPMNLVVYASIAAGAAIVQWMMSSGEEVKTLDSAVGDLEKSVKSLQDVGHRSLADLKKDFGAVTPEVIELNRQIAQAANVQALLDASAALKALRDDLRGGIFGNDTTGPIAELFNQPNYYGFGSGKVQQFSTTLVQLDAAKGFTAQLDLLDSLQQQLITATGGTENMTLAQLGYYNQTVAVETALRRMVAAQEAAARAQRDIDRATIPENARMGGPDPRGIDTRSGQQRLDDRAEAGRALADLQAEAQVQQLITQYGEDSWRVTAQRVEQERAAFEAALTSLRVFGDMRQTMLDLWDATKGAAAEREKLQQTIIDPADRALDRVEAVEAETAKLREQARIQALVAQYGEDSVEVTQARVAAERKAYEELWKSKVGAGYLLDGLLEAYDAGVKLGAVDMAGGVNAAAAAAATLARNLGISLSVASRLAGYGYGGTEGGPVVFDPRDPRYDPAAADRARLLGTMGELRVNAGSVSPFDPTRMIEAAKVAGGGASGGGRDGTDGLADLSVQARKAMSDLDLALATIQEKVQAGLMTTAEAAEGVTAAKEQAANDLAELIVQLERLGPAGQAAAQDIRAQMRGIGADLKATGTDLSKELSEGFKGPFAAFLSGAQPAKDAMSDFADHVKAKLAEIAAQEMQLKVITPLMDKAFSWAGSIFRFADGGAPDAPALAAHRNQVLDRPTLFPMARGRTGLMAEAGAEAIMPVGDGGVLAMFAGRETRLPLARGAGGRLGVDLGRLADRAPLPFALGGVPDGSERLAAPKVWRPEVLDRAPVAFARSGGVAGGGGLAGADAAPLPGRAAAQGAVASTKVDVHHYGPGEAPKISERIEGNTRFIEVIVGEVERHLGGNVRAGRGEIHDAMSQTFGLNRTVR